MTDRTVRGRCPACGWTALFLGSGGWVTCGSLECPNPTLASDILEHGRAFWIAVEETRDALGRASAAINRAAGLTRPDAVPSPVEGNPEDPHV